MKKGANIWLSIIMTVILLLSLPILYLCGMSAFVGIKFPSTASSQDISPYAFIIAFAIVILLDAIIIKFLCGILKKLTNKAHGNPHQGEAVQPMPEQKAHKNPWFYVPFVITAVCFIITIANEFAFGRENGNTIAIFSGMIIVFASIPLIISSIIFKGINKITTAQMLIGIITYIIAFVFAAVILGSKG